MTAAQLPEWITPPTDGYAAEDLDRIPDLLSHTELIDGSLVVAGPQSFLHMRAIIRLFNELERQAPDELLVAMLMTMKLADRQRPEPDISVVAKSAFRSLRQTDLPFEDAVLVIEVVSRESEIRDRERKPQLYAAAGIPHFWRVEDEREGLAVYVYELDPENSYKLAGVYRGRLEVDRPFLIDIDLEQILQP